ncbi:MAG: SPOR domain-containing protein [bacterium]
MKNILNSITDSIKIILTLLLFLSCAASEKVQRPVTESGTAKNFDKMNENFDPIALEDDDIKIKESDVSSISFEDKLVREMKASEDSMVTGYRVQLIQTTDPEEAKNVQRDAILRFNEGVYRVFDPPFYKVRVGDFINWYDAEKFQELAIKKGFREAWVIRTKVNLKNAYHWMDEL